MHRIDVILVMAFVTVATTFIRAADDEKRSPLADAVTEFNKKAADDRIGKNQPELTEDEVVASIRAWNRKRDPATDEVYKVFQEIADNGKLPEGAKLDYTTGLTTSNGSRFDVWWIDLSIMTGPKTGYTYRIRDRKLKYYPGGA